MEERPNKVFPSLVRSNVSRQRKDIIQWRSALQSAENVENPKRLLLYNIYDEIILDAHLTAEIQKRVLAVTGSDFKLYDGNNSHDADATEMLNQSWFTNTIKHAMDSMFWGHSLVEINNLNEEGKVATVKLVPRRHVRPEFGMVINKQSDEKGLLYREDQNVNRFVFEFGEPDELGLLNKAVPHILFKRFAQSAWSEYAEMYGMPLRTLKTNTKDQNSLNRLEQMLIDQATNSYAIIDNDDILEYVMADGSDGAIYEGLMKYSGNEVSKLILGSVIGESTEGGSRAKEEIGKEIQEAISKADKKWLTAIINDVILPKLTLLGYPFGDLTFAFDESKNIEAEWKMAKEISQEFELDPKEGIEYIRENFGVPVIAQKKQSSAPAAVARANNFFE